VLRAVIVHTTFHIFKPIRHKIKRLAMVLTVVRPSIQKEDQSTKLPKEAKGIAGYHALDLHRGSSEKHS